jgi:spore germination protein
MKLRLSMLLAILALVMAIAPAGTAQALYSDCHTVQPGETLSEIADHYNVTVQAIMQANHLDDPDVIYVGQCLVIPTKGS